MRRARRTGSNTKYAVRNKTMHATLCDLISDLTHNSIEADATEITLKVEETATQLKVTIVDNGKGMSAEVLGKAKDPFYTDGKKHIHRKVGLGLPFLFQTAETTGGEATVESEEGVGTTLRLTLDLNHIDLPEFGSFESAATLLMTNDFEGELTIERITEKGRYKISRSELKDALGDLNDTESLLLLKEFIKGNEDEI